MLAEHRRLLGEMLVAALMGGALLRYPVLQNRPLERRMVLVALASGFLITTVVQGIIPEANREGEPGFAEVLTIGGLSLFGLMSVALK
jgi:zinc transporter ZupT